MTFGAFFLAAASFVLPGYLILSVARFPGGLAPRLALSYIFGLGLISLEMFILSLLSVPWAFYIVLLPWVIFLACMLIVPGGRKMLFNTEKDGCVKEPFWFLTPVLFIIIAAQALYAFAYAGAVPITGWDSWQTWFFKAKAFYADGAVKTSLFVENPLTHPDYPLFVPLSAAWVYKFLGGAYEDTARLIYPLQFASLLSMFFYLSRRAASARSALVFTALLSLTPALMVHSAGFSSPIGGILMMDLVGYADLPLSIFILAAGGFLYLYAEKNEKSYCVLAAISLGMGAWTKDEGLALFVLGAGLVSLHMLLEKRPFAEFAVFISVAAAVAAPWLFYKALSGIPGEYEGSLSLLRAVQNTARLPVILRRMAGTILDTGIYNFTVYAYIVSTVTNLRRSFKRPLAYLHALVFLQLSAYAYIYSITFLDLNFHLNTSIDRVMLHVVPLMMFITAANFAQVFQCAPGPGGEGRVKGFEKAGR